MAQPNIIDFWKSYTGLLGNDINAKHGISSSILSYFKSRKKEWLEQSGHILQHAQYNRAGITADADAQYTDSDNAAFPESIRANSTTNYQDDSTGGASNNANNVDPPTDTLKFSYRERGYGMVQKAFNTDDFSAESLRAAAENDRQLQSVVKVLADTSKEYWVRMHRDEFSRVAGNRFIATGTATAATFVESGDAFECFDQVTADRWNSLGFSATSYDVAGTIDSPDHEAISQLTWGHLDDLYLRMVEEGGEHYTDIFSDGQPVFVLLTDLKTKRRLITDLDQGVRADLRESSMVDELLKPMGVTTSINGWVLMTDNTPRRFDVSNDSSSGDTGDWTERLVFENNGGLDSRTITSNYRSAAHVESYVMAPEALSCFALRPNYTGVGAATFLPQNYAGDFAFRVIEDKDDNPDGAHGFFRGKLANATVAEDPELLYVVRHAEGAGTAG